MGYERAMPHSLATMPLLGLCVLLEVTDVVVLRAQEAPYPPSPVIESITWHWETLRKAKQAAFSSSMESCMPG
jgi:hypothetical protein